MSFSNTDFGNCSSVENSVAAGCVQLIGAVVRQAISDAKSTRKDCRIYRDNAKDFLFHGDRLRKFFSSFGLKDANVDWIRQQAVRPGLQEKSCFSGELS